MSGFFTRAFQENFNNDPVIMLPKRVSVQDVNDLIEFMYTGKCIVSKSRTDHFLAVGSKLEIKGLSLKVIVSTIGKEIGIKVEVASREPSQETLARNSIDIPIDMSSPESSPVIEGSIQDPQCPEHTSKKTKLDTEKEVETEASKVSAERVHLEKSTVKSSARNQRKRNVASIDTVPRKAGSGILKCLFCIKTYKTVGHHQRHQIECQANPKRVTVVCPVCQESLKPSSLSRHKKMNHAPKKES